MIRKALYYSFTSKYITLIIQILSTLILARILTPEHIGLFSVAAIFTGIAQMFRDFGISEYIIKEKTITKAMLSAAFTSSVIIAWPIAFLLMAVSPLIGGYYSEVDIPGLILILTCNLFFSPFGSIPMAVMRKTMNFKPISYANIANTIVNAGASIVLAYMGFGAYSLAWASLAGTITTVTIITLYKPSDIRFGLTFSGIKKVLLFGKDVGGSNIFAYTSQNILELLIAKNFDMATLGLYSRGKSTITLFQTAILDAVQPLISPYYAQDSSNKTYLTNAYLKSTRILVYLSLPFCLTVGMFSESILLVLYGPQWLGASVYLKYLAAGFFIYTLTMYYEQLLTTRNMSALYAKFTFSICGIQIAIAMSSFWLGLELVLMGMVSMYLLRLLWVMLSLRKLISLTINDYVNSLKLPLLAGALFMFSILPIFFFKNNLGHILSITLIFIPAAIWCIFILVCDGEIRSLFKLKNAA